MSQERIKELEAQIEDLKARIPPHSVPPHLIQELEELEEELARLTREEAAAQAGDSGEE